MDISMEFYRMFYYVVKEGSISKAAQSLFISQPAVSQSIMQLEGKLGGKLFFRTPKGIRLTWEGETLFKYVEPAMNFIISGEKKFAEVQSLTTGEINIGASDMTCKYFLLPYLESFHKDYPGIKIHVTNGATPETLNLLKSGSIDFGVISLPIEQNEQLAVSECMEIQDCFVAGEKYKELRSKEISVRDLRNYPVLLLEKPTTTRSYIDEFTRKHGCELKPEIELATSDLLVQFAKRGLGISCVVRNFAEEELERSVLFEIKLKEKIPSRKIGLVRYRNVPLTAAADRFIKGLCINSVK